MCNNTGNGFNIEQGYYLLFYEQLPEERKIITIELNTLFLDTNSYRISQWKVMILLQAAVMGV